MIELAKQQFCEDVKLFITELQKKPSWLGLNDRGFKVPEIVDVENVYNVNSMIDTVVTTRDTIHSFNKSDVCAYIDQYEGPHGDIYVYVTNSFKLMLITRFNDVHFCYIIDSLTGI